MYISFKIYPLQIIFTFSIRDESILLYFPRLCEKLNYPTKHNSNPTCSIRPTFVQLTRRSG